MCISVPGQILEITDPVHRLARVRVGGQEKVVNLALLEPEEGQVGDWVVMQAGMAMQQISAEEAESILALLKDLDSLYQEE